MGFFFHFSAEASPKKNPTLNFAFLVFLFRVKMKRKILVVHDKKENRAKIERRKASMFCVNGPKFEEVNSVQLICLAAITRSWRHQDYGEKRWGGVFFR